MIYTKTNLKNKDTTAKQQGQALLFVVVAMTIALSIGISASVRTITSLSRTSRTDTAARALAAAEGGIERFIALPTLELEEAVAVSAGTGVTCPVGEKRDLNGNSYCLVDFDSSGDILVSQAYVSVERYTPVFYPFSLESGQVKEVNLYDFNSGDFYSTSELEICWTPTSASNYADIMYVSYNSTGLQAKGGLTSGEIPPAGYHQEGFTLAADGGHDGFTYCKQDVDISSNIYGLRLRTIGGDADIGIFPDGDDLPLQGYRITSLGRLEQDQGVVASRVVRIIRTLPYLPMGFDYGLYSELPILK